MNKAFIFVFLFLISLSSGFAQTKTVRIKKDRTVRFYYDKDSSCIVSHKDNKKLIRTFAGFFKAVYEDDFQTYLSLLSPATIEKIDESRLQRKFERFKSYSAHLFGKIQVEWIKKIKEKLIETEQIYMCILKLPEGQSVKKRVGFDPAKRHKAADTSYIGLMIVHIGEKFYVVIPW